MRRQERPEDHLYYERRGTLLSQGDIFRDVPLTYPTPPGKVLYDPEESAGARQFLSGPFEIGQAILTTPTCSMRAQQTGGARYAHPARVLASIRPVQELVDRGILDAAKLGLLRKYDGLINYMYLPPAPELELPESVALLYLTVALHHDLIDGQLITQLAYPAAQQLQRKLVLFVSGLPVDRNQFKPPMD